MHAKDNASQELGIQIIDVGPGRAILKLALEESMMNGNDVCHGGIVFTLADTAFAHACNSYNRITLAMSCSIDFLRATHPGDVLTATCQERSRGGRTGVYDVEIRDQESRPVATFRGRSYSTREPLLSY